MPNYGAIIIGTGQSGPALARRLLAAARSRNPSESIPFARRRDRQIFRPDARFAKFTDGLCRYLDI